MVGAWDYGTGDEWYGRQEQKLSQYVGVPKVWSLVVPWISRGSVVKVVVT